MAQNRLRTRYKRPDGPDLYKHPHLDALARFWRQWRHMERHPAARRANQAPATVGKYDSKLSTWLCMERESHGVAAAFRLRCGVTPRGAFFVFSQLVDRHDRRLDALRPRGLSVERLTSDSFLFSFCLLCLPACFWLRLCSYHAIVLDSKRKA